MDAERLFDTLCHRLNVQPDRRGETHMDCIFCGKEAKRGQSHFSFSETGASCLVCGGKCGLRQLWGILYGDEKPEERRRPVPRRKVTRRRYDIADHQPDFLVEQYESHQERMTRWREYAPTLPAVWIRAYRLGFGVLPQYSSRCQHLRLQVPLISSGKCVGFRARAVDCDCTKWLVPGGTAPTLFNGARILKPEWRSFANAARIGDSMIRRESCAQLWIFENPIDALLTEARFPQICAVATLGVTVWRDEWTRALVKNPVWKRVTVAYDNDHAGNVTSSAHAKEITARWRAEHNGADPPANGAKLVNRLLKAGVPATLHIWPEGEPIGADAGDLLR